jgi:tetrapyrrole methylase family protein/MazG family protein
LQWAFQIGSRAARTGFEWENTEEIHGKILEELNEFREATEDAEDAGGEKPAGERAEMEMEFGDLLFAMVQMARWQGIDPEQALRKSTRKFIARFQWMEEALRERGQQPGRQSSAEWWALWYEAKSHTD